MKDHLHRIVLAALAVVAVSSGLVSIVLDVTRGSAAEQQHVIELLNSGFNPESCWLSREDNFTFINKTKSTQRVLSNQNPNLDTGPIEPGATFVGGYNFGFIGSLSFYMESNPALTGKVTTDHGRQCEPLPPTPTPTNTPTPSPTPIPTPEGRKGLIPGIGRE
ncbi:MAG: hypothetical protein R3C29_00310 [Dehalococcoidia bacterium]|nr:hypothetical protein [Dehalococcoidia bacterium]